MAEKTIRAFIAIHLPENVKVYLGNLTDELAGTVPQRAVRWVRPDRMHLTLRFLGDTDLSLIPALQRAVEESAARHRQFTLLLEGFGCFPNCKRPRVLWAGVNGELAEAASLKRALDAALVPLGWEAEDRPFHPHLTLGRVNNARQLAGQRWPSTVTPLSIPAQAIHLVESNLTPDGPIYTVLHSGALRSP